MTTEGLVFDYTLCFLYRLLRFVNVINIPTYQKKIIVCAGGDVPAIKIDLFFYLSLFLV